MKVYVILTIKDLTPTVEQVCMDNETASAAIEVLNDNEHGRIYWVVEAPMTHKVFLLKDKEDANWRVVQGAAGRARE